jgi:hypothetical protein
MAKIQGNAAVACVKEVTFPDTEISLFYPHEEVSEKTMGAV